MLFTQFSSLISEKVGRMKLIKTMMKTASRQGFPPELKGLKWGNTEEVFNAEKTRMTQIPSANGHASARGELYDNGWKFA